MPGRPRGSWRARWLARVNPLGPPAGISRSARYTYALHLRAAGFDALGSGTLLLNDIVARKTLGASDLAITLLLMLPTIAQVVNLYWTGVGGRVRDPRLVFLLVGVPSRLALGAIGLVTVPAGGATMFGTAAFILLATIASTATTVVIPAQNAIYQANYAPRERGLLFARAGAWGAFVTVVVSTFLGWAYDRDERLYRIAYPLAGILAALGSWSWYRIRQRRRPGTDEELAPVGPAAVAAVPRPAPLGAGIRVAHGLLEPFRSTVRLFRADPAFLRFEFAFMTYGLAYMMLQPVLPLFLVDELKIDYSQAAHAKGLLFYGVMIALLPWAGRLNDRFGPVRLAAGSFLLLSLFPGLLLLARGLNLVYVAFAVFGAAMAGVSVTWTLGPLGLAGERSSERYMGAHVSLVALRGLIGFPLGYVLRRALGSHATFGVATVLEIVAALLMISVLRVQRRARTAA